MVQESCSGAADKSLTVVTYFDRNLCVVPSTKAFTCTKERKLCNSGT